MKECNIYKLISTKCVREGRRGSKFTFPPSLKSPLQGYTESKRDTSTGKLFSPPAVIVASVLLAQLSLTIKSAGFKSSGRICFKHSSVRWSWNNNIEKYVEQWADVGHLQDGLLTPLHICAPPSIIFPLISIGWRNFWQSASLCINTEHHLYTSNKPPGGEPALIETLGDWRFVFESSFRQLK